MMLRRCIPVIMVTSGMILGWETLPSAAEDKAEAKTEQVKIADITLAIPAEWKQEPPSNKLRLAQFKVDPVKGDKEPAELVVSSFGGGGGGIDPNLARWIGEFASEGRKVKLVKGESEQGPYYLGDLTGTFNKRAGGPFAGGKTTPVPGSRVLGIILLVPDKDIYFLKLVGPEKTVTAVEQEFRKSFGGDVEKEEKYEMKK